MVGYTNVSDQILAKARELKLPRSLVDSQAKECNDLAVSGPYKHYSLDMARYLSQSWLWERLFPTEKFPGVQPDNVLKKNPVARAPPQQDQASAANPQSTPTRESVTTVTQPHGTDSVPATPTSGQVQDEAWTDMRHRAADAGTPSTSRQSTSATRSQAPRPSQNHRRGRHHRRSRHHRRGQNHRRGPTSSC